MKVYDCFMFFNELDLLEIRFHELSEVVDYFVLYESLVTHQGEPKPLFFAENRDRYSEFLPKIIYLTDAMKIELSDIPHRRQGVSRSRYGRTEGWLRENYSREQLVRGLQALADDDIIIISDMDEIPSGSIVNSFMEGKAENGFLRASHKAYFYYVNWFYPVAWGGSVILSGRTFREGWESSPNRVRKGYRRGPRISSGWHFSSLGGIDAFKYKVNSFAHTEYNILKGGKEMEEKVNAALKYGCPINIENPDRSTFLEQVTIDETFPKFLRDNQEKFKHLIRR
jgi:beta-1,4-mannosyl-glycoprotein beta-1,4-N-acetylglucosaminyltransferase